MDEPVRNMAAVCAGEKTCSAAHKQTEPVMRLSNQQEREEKDNRGRAKKERKKQRKKRRKKEQKKKQCSRHVLQSVPLRRKYCLRN